MPGLNLKETEKLVLDLFNEVVDDKAEEVYDINGYELEECLGKYSNDNYSIEEVEHSGGEGQGEEMWKVFKIQDLKTKEATYFRKSGYYDSWNGTEWQENIELVESYEVTVTRWKSI